VSQDPVAEVAEARPQVDSVDVWTCGSSELANATVGPAERLKLTPYLKEAANNYQRVVLDTELELAVPESILGANGGAVEQVCFVPDEPQTQKPALELS
jgi:hypothetical protein